MPEKLIGSAVFGQSPDMGACHAAFHPFFNQEMLVCHRCNLCQVRDRDHLSCLRQLCHFLGYLLCGSSADAGVDLIEDHRLYGILRGHDGFDAQHDSGQFTAGCDTCKRTQRHAGIRGDLEDNMIRTIFRHLF